MKCRKTHINAFTIATQSKGKYIKELMNIKLRHIFVLLHNDMPGDSQVKDDVIQWRTSILEEKELRVPPSPPQYEWNLPPFN